MLLVVIGLPLYGQSSKLDAPISYSSQDSMVMMGNGNAFLHGKGTINYQEMELQSDYIRCNMDSNIIYASGVYDSINDELKGKPIFKDKKDQYESKEITYNLQTKKGIIRNVVTQQGEGYVLAEKTRRWITM